MQAHDWNDVKIFLALYRTGRLSEAGRILAVNETTVSRRLLKLEQALGAHLFVRGKAGQFEPTDLALEIANHAQIIESEHINIEILAGKVSDVVKGVVRISSVPVLINRFLIPRLSDLHQQHPDIEVELVPASENVDLTKREADLAVRFARPAEGGLSTTALKLGEVVFSIFAPADGSSVARKDLGWIGYDGANASLPQARWIEEICKSRHHNRAALRVADIETAIEAVAGGLGKSVLPDCVAGPDPRLQRILQDDGKKIPGREVWLLCHRDQSSRASVTAVKTWLRGLAW